MRFVLDIISQSREVENKILKGFHTAGGKIIKSLKNLGITKNSQKIFEE